MKKSRLCITALLTTALSSPAFAATAPDIDIGYGRTATPITIYARSNITINKVIGNGGSCQIDIAVSRRDIIMGKPKKRLPLKLANGTKWAFYSQNRSCSLREVVLETNQGTWSYDVN